ncbi:uncharacterized protein C2orf81 homolog isoform X1 [Phalacrocorax carbo]|uniref:uncharacterized protein C2orf81 homolog isoform X1 n=2 Tax=Phalacrocorax carbo TaxID=9209 RepID=UPI0031193086
METAARRDDARAARSGGVTKMTPRERAAAPRSRGEKARPPPITTARADVVPGRLPEAEWLSLLAGERGDGDVADVLAELLDRVMDGCSKAHAARQCVPFTVGQARDALLHIAQWRFLARDEGETGPEGDGTWQEDDEPEPCATDSWAPGSVPVLRVHQAPCPGEVSSAQPLCPSHVPTAGTILPVPGPSRPQLLLDEVAIAPRPPKGKPPRTRPPLPQSAPLCPARPPAPCPPPRQPEEGWRLSPRDVEGSSVVGVSSHRPPLPPPSCASLAKIRPGRPAGSTGAKREGSSTALGVPRLGPRSQPERWIRPQVEVLDLGTEAKPPARPQGAHRCRRGPELGTMARTQLQPSHPGSPQPPGPVPWQLGSLLDSARLAPGVTVRWGGSVKRGLRIPAHGEEEEVGEAKRDLRPIHPTVPFPAVAAREVTGDGAPASTSSVWGEPPAQRQPSP